MRDLSGETLGFMPEAVGKESFEPGTTRKVFAPVRTLPVLVSLFMIGGMLVLNGCAGKEQEGPNETPNETPQEESRESSQGEEELSAGDVPALTLEDSLSSLYDPVELKSANYSWNYEQAGEMRGMIACGSGPLDETTADSAEKLKLTDYNGMDNVPYLISAQKVPDTVTVSCWDASDLGNADAEAESIETYDPEAYIVALESGKVYEFAAEWSEENFEENGFYGTASYVLVTE